MNKKRVVKIVIVLGVIVLLIIAMHLIGNSLFPMLGKHFGL